MPLFSEPARERFQKFKSIKRAYYSLWVLGIAFVTSLFSPFIANDKPLILYYDGQVFFPIVKFYPGIAVGGQYKTEADYLKLRETPSFQAAGGWMLLPIIPYSPERSHRELQGAAPHPPSLLHWLGTDTSARDVLARLLYGFRLCMLFSISLMLCSTVIGVAVGGIQGYFGGKIDLLIQRFIEIWDALPRLYVVILVGTVYGRSLPILLVTLSLFNWISLSYYMRGEFLKLKNQTYVIASRSMGAGHLRIIFLQIFPNALGPLLTLLPFSLIAGIGALTSLDFLGFGVPPPTPSWGELLDQGLKTLYAPWLAASSVSALFITLLLATFIGEGVRTAFDPKSYHHLK